mmetsp:Transcript_52311/g.113382  ORF Transcript_52311/g.113382 Transcript_52311/m.113382 type:complete len:398 (+) Transcript_52311:58-1251(+)
MTSSAVLSSRAGCALQVLFLVALTLVQVSHQEEDARTCGIEGTDPSGGAASCSTGTDTTATKVAPQRLLLLCTHSRVLWLDVDTRQEFTVHEGRGVYYGAFPGEPDPEVGATIWVMSRPHNFRAKTSEELLLNIAADGSGKIVRAVEVASKFAHDAVRDQSGSRVLVASTEDGKVIEMTYPAMVTTKVHQMFGKKNHLNTISPGRDNDTAWFLLHGKRDPSTLVFGNLTTGTRVSTSAGLGKEAHGAVQMESEAKTTGPEKFLVLSSGDSTLMEIALDGRGGGAEDAAMSSRKIWVQQPPEFLKGLCVIGQVAYLGSSSIMGRQGRQNAQASLVAVDLKTQKELWRHSVQGKGLLNYVSTPQLSWTSSYLRQSDEWLPQSAGFLDGAWISKLKTVRV